MPQRDSVGYVVGVALVLCVVCSLTVSVAAVALKEQQELNKTLDRQKNILDATGLAYAETGEPASMLSKAQVTALFKRITEEYVDLETGEYVSKESLGENYDARKAAKDPSPEKSVKIVGPTFDPGVKQREKVAQVYFVRDEAGKIEQVVLPVYGKGLWSTLYGFLAVKSDLQTVQGLSFYEHAETPGRGGEVDNPAWKRQWEGRGLYGDEGTPEIGVAKGPAPKDDPYLVDGLSGATITARGVSNLVRYWVSDDAYGEFLKNLKAEIEQKADAPAEQPANDQEKEDGQE